MLCRHLAITHTPYCYEQNIRNPLTPKDAENRNSEKKSQISFCKLLKNKWYHAKVLLKRFLSLGFC